MSDIFSRLLNESGKQKQQIDSQPPPTNTQEVFPAPISQNVEIPRRNDAPTERRSIETTNRLNDPTTTRPSDAPTERRKTERAAFDLFSDQVVSIRRIRAERELAGDRKVSLSDIAREAFDMYLRARAENNTQSDEPTLRRND